MSNDFVNNASLGKNKWWHYALTTLLMVVFAAAFLLLANKAIVPFIKAHFEKTTFLKSFVPIVLVGGVFGFLLLGLRVGMAKWHQRSFASLMHADTAFSWRSWLMGFALWAPFVFGSSLWTDYDGFQQFLSSGLSLYQVLSLLLIGTLTIGIQATAEEIIFRGYLLQGLRLNVKNPVLLVVFNALIFALLHFGYGFHSLIETFAFGMVFTLLVLKSNRIEFAAGVHTVNNLVLIVFFPDSTEKINQFQWDIDWFSLGLSLGVMLVFYVLASFLVSKKLSDA